MNLLPFLALKIGFAGAGLVGRVSDTHEISAIYRLANQPTGTYRESEDVLTDQTIETMIQSDLVFNRLGTKLEVKSVTHYFETREGKLNRVAADLTSSAETTHVEATVDGASIAIATSVGGKRYDRKLPFTGALLGPHAVRRFVLDHLHAIGDTVHYQSFMIEFGAVATVTDKLLGFGEDKTGAGIVPGLKVEQTLSTLAGRSTLWLDKRGWMLSQSIPSPLGEIMATRSTGAVDDSASRGAELPAETFTRSIIPSNVRLPNERLVEEIKLKIIHRRPELGWPKFDGPNQRVLSKDAKSVILQVTRPQPDVSTKGPESSAEELRPFLAANALMQSDDPTVKAIAAKVVHKGDDAWTAVRALQKWTNDNMHFDLGVAIAPASEVARNRGGTCFGYSMLLGSLARAAGVPSRLRMGLVYAGGIWGGHAWVDVLIGNKWIPIDGALYSPGPADAARFSCFTGSLEENTISEMNSLAQLFGNVDVKILEYTVGGKHVRVPPDAKPFTVRGDTFTNSWLGVSVMKPRGFHYSAFDLAWPLTTVVVMEGPGGQRIELKNESASLPTGGSDTLKLIEDIGLRSHARRRVIGGRTVQFSHVRNQAVAVLGGKGSLWLVQASGPAAGRNLVQVVGSIKLTE